MEKWSEDMICFWQTTPSSATAEHGALAADGLPSGPKTTEDTEHKEIGDDRCLGQYSPRCLWKGHWNLC